MGDLDGDGRGDIAIGAPAYDNDEGVVLIYYGTVFGPAPQRDDIVDLNQTAHLGGAIAGGDVNGDGFDDLVLGAWSYGGNHYGTIRVHLGSAAGIAASPAQSVDGVGSNAGLGVSVAVGDVNGDGVGDLIAGQKEASPGSSWGAAMAWMGL